MAFEKPSVIIASNRGAFAFDIKDGEITASRGAGGLVTALSTAMRGYDSVWISAAISAGDKHIAKNGIYDQLEDVPHNFRFVDIDDDSFNGYYNLASNRLLWFCYHYLWKLSSEPVIGQEYLEAWRQYRRVNELFAQKILAESKRLKDPLIFLHDYHLLLAAKYIRATDETNTISHFSHTAWPQPDYMAVLPEEILGDIFEGMLANDILGFQSEKYRHNFLLCCEQLTDYEVNFKEGLVMLADNTVRTGVYPISVDSESIARQAESEKVDAYVSDIREDFQGLKIILRIERADPTKNTLRGIEAYRRLLAKYPEYRKKVVYMCLLYQSRTDIEDYIDYFREVQAAVKSVNKEFGSADWEPIYFDVQDNYERSLASLKLYDVLVVNSIYDGMNLVAKEGPIVNENDGVLLLSQNTGAYDEIGRYSIGVNPFSIEDTADKMNQALFMDTAQRREMHGKLVKAVRSNTSQLWFDNQINDLMDSSRPYKSMRKSSIDSSTLSIK